MTEFSTLLDNQTIMQKKRSLQPGVIMPELVRIKEFSKIKKVSDSAVRKAIADGRISTVLVGREQVVFINLDTYKDFKFDSSFKRK